MKKDYNNMDSIQELENRLKRVEETVSNKQLESALAEELKNYKGDDEVIPFSEFQEAVELVSFSTGISKLNELLDGFHEGDLVVVTGPTGQGKTTLLQTFTINLSKQGIKSLWFTYEITASNLIKNFGADVSEGYIPKVLMENSIIWIERKIVEAIVKFGIKAVFIDPFNSLTKFASPNLSQELGDLSERLKQIALKYNIILFTSAHTRKLTANEVVYTEDTIRDTALLGNKANTIIAFWRCKERQSKHDLISNGVVYTNESNLSVVKNRYNGKTGFVKVRHAGNKFLLSDYGLQTINEEIPNYDYD